MSGPAIAITGLRKTYGLTVAVDGLDLTIQAGEVVALIGPNGAGKSTTIDLMLGLGVADSGSIRLFNRTPAEAISMGAVGAMLQNGGLIQLITVEELLTMMASLYRHPNNVTDILERTGLVEAAKQQASKLSGGQTQRLRFALALVSNPALLVLDEPTAALDVEGRHAFWDAIRGYTEQGRTVLFATHYLEEADRFADRIILMARGRIVADGSATQIKSVVDVRTVRATLAAVAPAALADLPGVRSCVRHGDTVTLVCTDSDQALRALLQQYPEARDLEVHAGSLDDAFRQLTSSPGDDRDETP